MILPPEAAPILAELATAFIEPTYRRFVALTLAAVLTTGGRTVANLLRILGAFAPGHRTDYQRVFSRAPWSTLRLGCALAGFILTHMIPDGPVVLVGDDTVDALREKVRRKAGGQGTPSKAVIDSQSIKTTEVGGEERGYDGGKLVGGRKRHIAVDIMGLLLDVAVTAASVDDGNAAPEVLGS